MTSLKVLVIQYNSFNGFVCTVFYIKHYGHLNMLNYRVAYLLYCESSEKKICDQSEINRTFFSFEWKKGLTLVIYAKNVWYNNVFYCSLKSALYFWITLYIKRNLMFQNEVFYLLNLIFYKEQPIFKIKAASLNSQLGYEFNFFAQIFSFN